MNKTLISLPADQYIKLSDKLNRIKKNLTSIEETDRLTYILTFSDKSELELDKRKDFKHFINT